MKKEGLVEALAEKTGKTKSDAKRFLDAFVQVVTETLVKGGQTLLVLEGSMLGKDLRGLAEIQERESK